VSAINAFAAHTFNATTWQNLQTYDVRNLKEKQASLIGKLVSVRFNYRHKKIRHLKPNWYQGSLWQYETGPKKSFSFVQVMVAKDAVPAFKAIPTNFQAQTAKIAYGQVLRDTETGMIFVKLLGTKVIVDDVGNVVVDW
jgi:hypothetical protein